MATSLVTGGTGFVGRELVAQLKSRGDTVTVLSRRRPPAGVRWLEADITNTQQVDALCSTEEFDVVYHLASLPGDTGHPRQMVAVNINGLTNMLEVARRGGIGCFVLASSISAYEWYPATKFCAPLEMPVSEKHPCRPRDMYSSTKRMQEILAETYYHQYGVPTTILRVTAVVGPHGSGGGQMWREFAEQLQAGVNVQLPMYSAEELSHFVDVRDVAAMHIVAGTHPAAVGETFNCCAGSATRGRDFASIVEALVPGAKAVFGFPWSMAQGGEIEFDMSKAKSMLDFEPKYSLADAIESIRNWVAAGGLRDAALV